MKSVYILMISLFMGCASAPKISVQTEIKKCIKEMRTPDDGLKDSFEVCRQIYGLRKVKEYAPSLPVKR